MTGSLSIIHCMRAPLGGLFRHVCDLVALQEDAGHDVGIVCDSGAASEATERTLRHLAESVCSLGVARIPMSRQIGWRDVSATRAVLKIAETCNCDVLHGHGAKGGAYVRLAASRLKRRGSGVRAFYTPHGGSLHYKPRSVQGRLFMELERRLGTRTDGLIFESAYSSEVYRRNVGAFPCDMKIIHNGLRPEEFYSLVLDMDAFDFVFVGELRKLKGVDVFLKALARINLQTPVRAYVAGSGPHERAFKRLSRRLGLSDAVTFAGPTPARAAFARGQCLVVPSRAESLPYIVLEAAAAGLPFIASDVGGIPEIVEGSDVQLVAPDDVDALAAGMRDFLDRPTDYADMAVALQGLAAKRFNVRDMANSVMDFYESKLPKGRAR